MDGDALRERCADAVIRDHLRLRAQGDLDEDLERNIAPNVVVLTRSGTWHGHEGVRRQARALRQYTPHESFDYEALVTHGDAGYLEWSAGDPGGARIVDGADSYFVTHGWIAVQTIHYTVRDPRGRRHPATPSDR